MCKINWDPFRVKFIRYLYETNKCFLEQLLLIEEHISSEIIHNRKHKRIDFQTHRLRRAPRRNCGPCSSSRCTWRTVPPASLPESSGIPAQTRNGLIKLTVIKNRSGEGEGRRYHRERDGSGSSREEKKRSIELLFTARRAFPKALRVNKGKIICGLWPEKKARIPSHRVCSERKERIFVQTRERRHVWCATCAAALQFPGRLLIAGERNGGYFARACLRIANTARKCSPRISSPKINIPIRGVVFLPG